MARFRFGGAVASSPMLARRRRLGVLLRRSLARLYAGRVRELAFPDVTFVTLRFMDTKRAANTVGSNNFQYVYYGNDPYFTDKTNGTTYRMTGFDQWSSIYNQCYISASKIKVTFTNTASPCAVTLTPTAADPSTTGIGWPEIGTQGHAKNFLLDYDGSDKTQSVEHYMTTSKIWGDRNSHMNPDYWATIDPTTVVARPWYWSICARNYDASDTSAGSTNVIWLIEITYYCKWFAKKLLPES